MACPDDNKLIEYIEGRLGAEEAVAVGAHVDGCAICREVCEAVSATTEAQPRSSSQALRRYELRKLVGQGGMGVVYEAWDPELARRVAIKLLREPRPGTSAADLHARLLREAKALARLAHPNVVAVHDVGRDGAHSFLAMEFVEGQTLGAWLGKKRSWRESLDLLLQAGSGLAAAHEADVVHRDFKPGNVLIGADGRARVTDFGLARFAAPGADPAAATPLDASLDDLTRTGALVGSPAFMSPEQFEGGPVDARSDVFSWCVTLYLALYGVRPFAGRSLRELRDNIVAGRLHQPERDEVPAWLRALVLSGLAVDPAQRPAPLRKLLEQFQRGRADAELTRAAQILAEAQQFFQGDESPRALSSIALSLLQAATSGVALPAPASFHRPDLVHLPEVEASGSFMSAMFDLMGPFSRFVSHYFSEGYPTGGDGALRFEPDRTYRVLPLLLWCHRFVEIFGGRAGSEVAYASAKGTLRWLALPKETPGAQLVEAVSLLQRSSCFLGGRPIPECAPPLSEAMGRTRVTAQGANFLEVSATTPWPCDNNLGFLRGLLEEALPGVVIQHLDGPCRKRGDFECRYVARWP